MAYKRTTRFAKSFEFVTENKIKVKIEEVEDMYVINTLFRLPPSTTDDYNHLYSKYRGKLDFWCRNHSTVLKFDNVVNHIYIVQKPEKPQDWSKSTTAASKVITEYYLYPRFLAHFRVSFEELKKAVEYALTVYNGVEFIDAKEKNICNKIKKINV